MLFLEILNDLFAGLTLEFPFSCLLTHPYLIKFSFDFTLTRAQFPLTSPNKSLKHLHYNSRSDHYSPL